MNYFPDWLAWVLLVLTNTIFILPMLSARMRHALFMGTAGQYDLMTPRGRAHRRGVPALFLAMGALTVGASALAIGSILDAESSPLGATIVVLGGTFFFIFSALHETVKRRNWPRWLIYRPLREEPSLAEELKGDG